MVVDGGMATFEVVEKVGNDLVCKCTDPGLLLSRAKLSFRRNGELVGKSVGPPTLSAKVSLFSNMFFQVTYRQICRLILSTRILELHFKIKDGDKEKRKGI